MNLKDIPLNELLDEVNRREKSGEIQSFKNEKEFSQIKDLNIKGLSTANAVVEYYIDERDKYNNGGPHFMFFFRIEGKKKLQDFYYGNHGLEYEDWTSFIPSCFAESMENCYEYHGEGYSKGIYEFLTKFSDEDYYKTLKSTIDGAIKTLNKCGYKEIKKIEKNW